MNRAKLKSYAPQARRDFIQAMTDRAAFYGLTARKTEPVVEKGDVAVIGGRSFPVAVAKKRKSLEDRIKRHGFEQTMEAMAYTWFNRLVAIRFMELHGYLDHGYRVLSPRKDTESTETDRANNFSIRVSSVSVRGPEILEHAEHVELPGLKRDAVIDLKLAGNKESELYRLLLTAQCNALNKAMPLLFEKIDDETELLLPDNLLHSDSLIRTLVNEILEEDWQEVEIIGWLYQFYISEKKEQVIGKVVASEDIPAATQLFTPNWIVKYLVQNTLGRQWLEHHPNSSLKAKMEYYIEPAEQTPEVQAQLQEMIRQRAVRNRGLTTDNTDGTDHNKIDLSSSVSSVKSVVDISLNPEELTLLDPACGSGHILVEAYDLFKAIYQERGYRARDIPALILQKNLFGLEIDDRAAQLAAFALIMKARADDRRIFDSEAKPNIVAFEDSQGMKASEIHFALTSPLKGEQENELEPSAPDGHLFEPDDNLFTRAESAKAAASRTPASVNFSQSDIAPLLELFENAKTFGSLIQVPSNLAAKLPEIEKRVADVLKFGDLTHASAHVLKPLLEQARLLARQYDAVVANPPYMGGGNFNDDLKAFVKRGYSSCIANLYACFIKRNMALVNAVGSLGMINLSTWMFLEDYRSLRTEVIASVSVHSFLHNGRGVWGSDFDSCAFVLTAYLENRKGVFRRLYVREFDVQSNEDLQQNFFDTDSYPAYHAAASDFGAIPGSPIAFWLSKESFEIFKRMGSLSKLADPKVGLQTGDNPRFLRLWFEIDRSRISFDGPGTAKWYPYAKGGEFRKWFGNAQHVINWQDDGHEVRNCRNQKGKLKSRPQNAQFYFREAVEWSDVGQSIIGARFRPNNYHYDVVAMSAFSKRGSPATLGHIQCFLNSTVAARFMNVIAPGMHYNTGYVGKLPLSEPVLEMIDVGIGREATELARLDWNSHEMSWDFDLLATVQNKQATIQQSQDTTDSERLARIARLKQLEEENNRLIIEAYGLQDELSPEVPDDQITLYRPDREEDIKRLLSYAIGCIMGRYSLDKPGLIYAHSGNQGFDPSQYKTFRADDDGIIPLLETDWGIRDDATNRFVEFINVCWPGDLATDNTDGTDEKKSNATLSVSSVKSVVKSSPYLEENLKFVADSLGATGSEQSRDTIRRYLSTGFYKHHLSMYKKRPIYWLFSSGKQRAFQCLVYLHRYHEGTLARMRTEYVIPLQGQIAARIEQLEGDKTKATSTSHRKKLQKEQDDLKKKQTELLTFEEKLKHAADQKISFDLDDGVKVNYAKFGDLLAESNAITGGKEEE